MQVEVFKLIVSDFSSFLMCKIQHSHVARYASMFNSDAETA